MRETINTGCRRPGLTTIRRAYFVALRTHLASEAHLPQGLRLRLLTMSVRSALEVWNADA